MMLMLKRYKSLHLSAMGAAIPPLVQLAISLQSTLPFPAQEIHTELITGTVDVTDELIPDEENEEEEDINLKTRSKSTLRISIKIGDGDPDDSNPGSVEAEAGRSGGFTERRGGKNSKKAKKLKQIVLQEPEQEDPDGV
jgi:ribonuclease P/MRP protein subunit RPP20